MKELELFKFVQDKEIDWRGDLLILWIHPSDLKEFADLLGYNYLSEDGLNVNLRDGGTVAVELNDVCEAFDIEPENILAKETIFANYNKEVLGLSENHELSKMSEGAIQK